jgi:hypothetical protein
VKYLINKNYTIQILLNIRNFSYKSLTLGYFCRRLTDHKQRVNKKQKAEIDSPAPSRGQGNYMKYVSVPWPLLESALSILKHKFFVKEQLLEQG